MIELPRKLLMFTLFSAFVFFSGSTTKILTSAQKYITAFADNKTYSSNTNKNSDSNFIKNPELNPDNKIADNKDMDPDVRIVISFAGDCTIGTDESFPFIFSLPEMLQRQNNDYSYFFSGVKHIFEEDDLTLVNLEAPLTNAVDKAQKTYSFKGETDYVNILKAGSIEMVSISNNHIYDYLQKGYDETLETLNKAEIKYSGEGHVSYFNSKGINIASISYLGWDTSIKRSLENDIEEAQRKADIVIVSFHWGSELSYYPDDVQVELAHFSIDAGANAVIGHHPHVVQGIEKYKSCYIVYSLGNFCFGGNCNPADKDTMIFQNEFTFSSDRLLESRGKIIPCRISSVEHINDYKTVVLEGSEGQRVKDRILMFSSSLKFGIKAENE